MRDGDANGIAWLFGLANPQAEKPMPLRSDGEKYYFCSEACRKEFEAEPWRYRSHE
jgi:hypothetical protein